MDVLDFSKLPQNVVALLSCIGRTADERRQSAFLVGGMVRDLLMGRISIDVDIVTEGDAIALGLILAGQLSGRLLAHSRFGTAVLTLSDGTKVDLVTARRESYDCPGALPRVESAGIHEDLYRRDFTINAIAASILPSEFGALRDDYYGREDISKKVIRILHQRSFADDPTRIVRAVKYAARFGFEIERGTLEALETAVKADVFSTVTPVRYWNELRRVLSEADPGSAIKCLRDLKALRFLSGEHKDPLLDAVKTTGAGSSDRWAVFAAILLSDRSLSEARTVLTTLGATRKDKEIILKALKEQHVPDMLSRPERRKSI